MLNMEEANSWLKLRHQISSQIGCSWRRSSRLKNNANNNNNNRPEAAPATGGRGRERVELVSDGGPIHSRQLGFCLSGEQVRWAADAVDTATRIDAGGYALEETREEAATTNCHSPMLKKREQREEAKTRRKFSRPSQSSERPKEVTPSSKVNNLSYITTTLPHQNHSHHCCHRHQRRHDAGTNMEPQYVCHENGNNVQSVKPNVRYQHRRILLLSPIVILLLAATSHLFAGLVPSINRRHVAETQSSHTSHLVASAYQLTNNLIANNLPPKFVTSTSGQASNSEIVVRVKEGPGSIGKLIYTLRGEDPDEDPLTFGVLGSMASDLLRIENVPGNQANVYLRKELDRETTESYQVVITLSDGKLGRGNWITKSMLIIVEDVNDNYPVFGPHRTAISIREDSKAPLVIETIEASDQDEGRFGQVIYKLDELRDEVSSAGERRSQSEVSSMFAIETIEGKGVISLIGQLDYEQRALYQLRILAIDRAIEQERLTASTSIMISVEDCEDQPPMFTFVPSITRIPESLPVGSPVVRVSAIDGDRGINNPIQHKLLSVNGQESGAGRQLFSMDADTGLISTAHELDRESSWPMTAGFLRGVGGSQQPGSYVLQVRATEVSPNGGGGGSSQENSVTTELTILLTDVNDETPTFNQLVYLGEILENSAPDNLVTFVSSPPQATTAIGYETGTSSHQQLPAPLAKVIDRDQGTNGTFTLHLEGEHAHLFDVWPHEATNEANFMIKVSASESAKFQLSSGALDYERTKVFQFSVVAREKYPSSGQARASSSAQMSVYLKDSNDNYPQFESELYRVEIPENAIRGMHICAVKATDADSGLYGTMGIRYTEIRGEKANKFKLDPVTGVITLKTNEHGFDRETIAQHHLIVEARDNNGSGNRNTTQLLIILTDVNDQKPKFLLDQYEAFIYENELDFQSPLQVQAVDNDAPNTSNSRVSYSIVGGDPQQNFTIDPQTGRIKVRSSLVLPPVTIRPVNPSQNGESDIVLSDSSSLGATHQVLAAIGGLDFERIAQKRDDTRQFNLTIRATDSGLPEQLSGQTQVLVLVYDRNDHAPVFTRSVYSKSIREDIKEGSQVLQVLAQDGDHSPSNSKITYRISSGASDKFVIDSDSGLISVANGANLDIDRAAGGGQKRTNYLLSVLAFDGSFGPNQKSATCLVNISIIDVNNKPPEFTSFGGSTSQSRASLAGGSQPPSSGSSLQQQVVYVNEDAPYGLVVTRVTATDLDSSAELRYSINYAQSEARNEDMVVIEPALVKDLFAIEPVEGIIKVAKQLDRELFDQVKLRLQVEDVAAQTADQVAFANLLIKITDVNDNRPMFKRPVYKAVVNENSISGTSVITLTADDRDLNKTLKYSLDAASLELMRLVRINPRTGEVTVNDKIDRELHPMINVTVKAEDSGLPHPLTGSAQLMITVRDENDNNPMFVNSSTHIHQAGGTYHQPRNHNMMSNHDYRPRSLQNHDLTPSPSATPFADLPLLGPGQTASVREDAPVGHQVAYVQAEDADVGNNGRVTYLLDAASSGGKFRVERDSGIISVAATLDRETTRHYSLIIEACDNYDLGYSTGESRRAFTQVNIQVTDINDNVPVISTNLQPTSGANAVAVSALGAGSMNTDPQKVSHHQAVGGGPSYEEIMSSPGPYETAMSDCLFINEFQPLNEPILTIAPSDADDSSLGNGQTDLVILNNQASELPLFSLVPISSSLTTAAQVPSTTITPTTQPADFTGFGDLTLSGESASLDLAASESAPKPVARLRSYPKRSRRSAHDSASFMLEPVMSGNTYYSRASAHLTTNTINQHSPAPSASIQKPSPSAEISQGERQYHMVVSESLKERVGNYTVVVRASDRGQPSLSAIKMINVCVLDVNNHSPVFIRPPLNHTIRVMENATIGSYVTQVEASDSDHGPNGQLQYSLKATNIQNNNNDWQAFKIDRLSGVISTAKQFNRQVKKYYTLRVQAQDFGRPTALSSDIDINIMIVNSGQYQPEFDNQLQLVQFTENVVPEGESIQLTSTANQDDDPALINNQSGGNWRATPCYFIIDSDDRDQVFHLDRYTHKLTYTQALDRERQANYTLLVQATNNCNKQPPSPIYATALASEAQPISAVNTMGQSASLKLRANNDTSSLQTTTPGNKEYLAASSTNRPAASWLNQAALDALVATDKSLLKVFIKIKDVNDNAPKFTQRVYTGGITTEADFGTVFMIVQANDADADANSQIVYSLVKPIKRSLATMSSTAQTTNMVSQLPQGQKYQASGSSRQRRSALATLTSITTTTTTNQPPLIAVTSRSSQLQLANGDHEQLPTNTLINDIPMNEGDDLFVINAQTGEISLNFDPQKHMKGYFEFDVMANDTDGLFDSAKVFIYLLRQDQRVKFVLRLTPQELRQRLNKFRSVFGNITGAIVNIDSYKYYENHDGTVDKKKTSLYLHFVNPDDNTIIDVDKVLTMIDNSIEYLDELYKEFHVLSSEAAHLPLSSSALIDPIDQIRTGLLGVSSFLALILILVVALCLNQRSRYERQLKAATVSAFGSSPLHLDPDYQSQTNLPNTNLHSQDPNPIWINGYNDQDWLSGGVVGGAGHKSVGMAAAVAGAGKRNSHSHNHHQLHHHLQEGTLASEDADYLSSGNSDLNSLSGVNSVNQLHYNATTTATPRDSLNSSHGRVSGSGSGSTSTTNERQVLCRGSGGGHQSPQQQQQLAANHQRKSVDQAAMSNLLGGCKTGTSERKKAQAPMPGAKKRSQLADGNNSVTHSTFGAFKEVTIYTDHHQKQYAQQQSHKQRDEQVVAEPTSQVNKIASQLNAKHQSAAAAGARSWATNQVYIGGAGGRCSSPAPNNNNNPNRSNQQRIQVHANGADLSQGIIKQQVHKHHQDQRTTKQQQQHPDGGKMLANSKQQNCKSFGVGGGPLPAEQRQQHPSKVNGHQPQMLPPMMEQHLAANNTVDGHESNLNKLSILNLETTEL